MISVVCYLFWNFYNQDEKYIIFIRDKTTGQNSAFIKTDTEGKDIV